MPALLGDAHAGVTGTDRGSDNSTLFQFTQIQEVERRDAGGHTIRGHPGKLTAGERQPHQIELLDDRVREARISPGVESECRQVVPVVVQNLPDSILHIPRDGLAFPKHHTCHGVE